MFAATPRRTRPPGAVGAPVERPATGRGAPSAVFSPEQPAKRSPPWERCSLAFTAVASSANSPNAAGGGGGSDVGVQGARGSDWCLGLPQFPVRCPARPASCASAYRLARATHTKLPGATPVGCCGRSGLDRGCRDLRVLELQRPSAHGSATSGLKVTLLATPRETQSGGRAALPS